jgi:hypothetical protein
MREIFEGMEGRELFTSCRAVWIGAPSTEEALSEEYGFSPDICESLDCIPTASERIFFQKEYTKRCQQADNLLAILKAKEAKEEAKRQLAAKKWEETGEGRQQ